MQRQVVQQNQPLLKLRLTKLTFAKATFNKVNLRQGYVMGKAVIFASDNQEKTIKK